MRALLGAEDLAQQLARQWQRADWRERQLLPGPGAWPVRLAIGAPSAAQFAQGGADLRAHLQAWRAIQAEGPGQVQWQDHRYQGAAAPLAVPTHWLLGRPSEAIAAMARHAGGAGRAAQADYQALQAVLPASQLTVDSRLAEMHFGQWEGVAWNDIPRHELDAWAANFAHCQIGRAHV